MLSSIPFSFTMSVQDILEEYSCEVKLQHAAWVECLQMPADAFHTMAMSESQRLNNVLIDVHRRLSRLRRSDLIASVEAPSAPASASAGAVTLSFRCSLHAVPAAALDGALCRRRRSRGHRGSRGSSSLLVRIFEVGPLGLLSGGPHPASGLFSRWGHLWAMPRPFPGLCRRGTRDASDAFDVDAFILLVTCSLNL